MTSISDFLTASLRGVTRDGGQLEFLRKLSRPKLPEFTGHALLDHLGGAGEDRWRHREAERLRGLEIDDQLECGWLLHRQIGRLGALKDLSGINANLAIGGREA